MRRRRVSGSKGTIGARLAVPIVLVLGSVLAACGGGGATDETTTESAAGGPAAQTQSPDVETDATSTGAPEAPTELRKVNFGAIPSPDLMAPVLLADSIGAFERHGLEVDMNLALGGPTTRDAVVAGQLEVGMIAANVAALSFQGGQRIRIVGCWYDAEPFALMLNPESAADFRGLEDLAGERIATSQPGAAANILTSALINAAGLSESDLETIFLSDYRPPVWASMFTRGEATGALTWEPTITYLEEEGLAEIVIDLREPETAREVLELSEMGESMCFASGEETLQDDPDLIRDFMSAVKEGYDAIEQMDDDELLEVFSTYLEADASLFQGSLSPMRAAAVRDTYAAVDSVAANLEVYQRLDVVDDDIDIDKLVVTKDELDAF